MMLWPFEERLISMSAGLPHPDEGLSVPLVTDVVSQARLRTTPCERQPPARVNSMWLGAGAASPCDIHQQLGDGDWDTATQLRNSSWKGPHCIQRGLHRLPLPSEVSITIVAS